MNLSLKILCAVSILALTNVGCNRDNTRYTSAGFGFDTCKGAYEKVNGVCQLKSGYIPFGRGVVYEGSSPFASHAPGTGMDSLIVELDLSHPSDSTRSGVYNYGLTISPYSAKDSLGIGLMGTLYATFFTQMPDQGPDSVKFKFFGDGINTTYGIINYYGRMNRTGDTVRGYVNYYQTNVTYPVV